MSQQHPPIDDEAFEKLQAELREQYRQQAIEQPPEAIDKAILALAKQRHTCQTKQPTLSAWKQHQLAIASAASITLVAGLLYFSPELLHQIQPHKSALQLSLSDSTSAEKLAQSSADNVLTDADSSVNTIDTTALSRSSTATEIGISRMASTATASKHTAQLQPEHANELNADSSLNDTSNDPLAINAHSQRGSRAQLSASSDIINKRPKTVELDTAENAVVKLTEHLEKGQLPQARLLLKEIEQRFPELNNTKHPLYEKFIQLKQQLTSQ
ncbi:hypothetical protein ACFOD0_06650 [Shewanella intestini]|uniref:Anti-sigma factor n=1 Tax=Shewanella intestini TaxID=2017544 RepID=A0ABS5HXX7_9GAMM|nr:MULTISPECIES: hypothetical protein [Shewanella]MBR9726552.1 hypothetical protein [Shewanella intestini]MRG34882.1 hypothetical protein [Shewanella sp. XMDDZSB0408]